MDAAPGPEWTVGNELRKLRKDAGLQQVDIALAVGVARQTISNWENDKGEPTISEWRKIMLATGKAYLFPYKGAGVTLTDVSHSARLPFKLPPARTDTTPFRVA